MTDRAHRDISDLARRAVVSGLRLRDARALFDALYVADALALESGHVTRAAERAGLCREAVIRQQRKRLTQ